MEGGRGVPLKTEQRQEGAGEVFGEVVALEQRPKRLPCHFFTHYFLQLII